jgi:iron complex outermembrane recepter protein
VNHGAIVSHPIFDGARPPRIRPRRTLASLATLLLFPLCAGAQASGTIEGRAIHAASGDPLSGVTIRAEGAPPVVTGPDGRFVIARLQPGAHRVTASRVGLQPATAEVRVSAGASAEVVLRMADLPLLLPDVVVSATRETQRRADVPSSVGAVDGAELRELRPTHPADAVNRIAGVWVSPTRGEGHLTAIRQPITTKPVYLFLEDGVPTRSTGFFNHNGLYEVNVPQADRIEVVKGPGSALHGSDAIGGAVNVMTRAPSVIPQFDAAVEGSGLGWARVLASASGSRGAHGVRADVNLTRGDTWRDAGDYDRQSATLRWDMHLGAGAGLRTVATYTSVSQQDPSSLSRADWESRPQVNYNPIAFREVRALRVASALEKPTRHGLVSVTPFYRWNTLDLLPSWMLTYDPVVYTTGHRSYGLLAKYRHDLPVLDARVIAGVDVDVSPGFRRESTIAATRAEGRFVSYAEGVPVYDYDVTFRGVSPYAQVEAVPMPGLRITGGLRYDRIGYDYTTHLEPVATGRHRRPESTGVSFRNLSPKVGATYNPAREFGVFAGYSRGFRAPSEGHLFRQGTAVSSVDLRPVVAESREAGVRGEVAGRFSYDVSAYHMRVRDDILTYTRADNLRESQNAGETLHRGVEFAAGARLLPAVRLDAAYTLARHTYTHWTPSSTVDFSGNAMETAPETLANVRLTYGRPAGGRASAEWVRMGSFWMDPANTHRYPGHGLLNLSGTLPVHGGLDLVMRLNNVLDTRYAERASFDVFQGEQFSPGMPRTIYAGVRLRAETAR